MKNVCQRSFDLAAGTVGIALMCAVILKYGRDLKAETDGSLFFRQDRVGKNGKLFLIWKLRTMNEKRDDKGNYLPNADRIGPIGDMLRRKRYDELPNFINVLLGDMHAVGYRPIRKEDVFIGLDFERHFNEKPGITSETKLKFGGDTPHIVQLFSDLSIKSKTPRMGLIEFFTYQLNMCMKTVKYGKIKDNQPSYHLEDEAMNQPKLQQSRKLVA